MFAPAEVTEELPNGASPVIGIFEFPDFSISQPIAVF